MRFLSDPEKTVDGFIKGSLGFFGVLAVVLLFPLFARYLVRRMMTSVLKKILLTFTMGLVSGKVIDLLMRKK